MKSPGPASATYSSCSPQRMRTLRFVATCRFRSKGVVCKSRPIPYRQIPTKSLSDEPGHLRSNRMSKSDRLLGRVPSPANYRVTDIYPNGGEEGLPAPG